MDALPDETAGAQRLAVKISFPQRVGPTSEGARASLEAVRVAQEAARSRARRETLRARACAVGVVVGIALPLALWPSLRKPDAPAAQPGATLAAATAPSCCAEPQPIRNSSPEVALPSPEAPARAADASRCDDHFQRRHWRMAAEACANAFQARPNDASFALRVAEAQYARNHLAEAGEWATRAIALDRRAAQAFIILAHAEAQAGHPAAAAKAYRQYLARAPRGRHATEARRALTTATPKASAPL